MGRPLPHHRSCHPPQAQRAGAAHADGTAEPSEVLETVEAHGSLVLGGSGELMVEFADQKAVDALTSALSDKFGDQVLLAP
jgi:hypothetical protein